MKNILFFLILIVFVICQPSNEIIEEEVKKERKKQEMEIVECILKSPDATPEFKKLVEENKDKDLMRVFYPEDYKIDKKDHAIMVNCRKEMFNRIREEQKRERERDIERDRKHKRHHEETDL